MIVEVETCICRDPRVKLSMTRTEAEILSAELTGGFPGTGPMFKRVRDRLAAVLTPAAPKKEKAK
jgi:hypothetical protein